MLKFLDHDETYDPAYRRIIRDGGVKYDLKRDDAFLVRQIIQVSYQAKHVNQLFFRPTKKGS